MNRALAILLTLLVLPAAARAGKLKTWTAATPVHWEKATFQNVAVSSEGTLRLARQLQALEVNLEAARIWDALEDKQGNLIVATGDEGKIFRITPDGKITLLFDSEDSQVLCLAAAADGTVYAGTGPSGLIVRITPAGNATILYDSPESYIWALAYDEGAQALFAATGPHGRIYHVDSAGKGEIHLQTRQEHILSLIRGGDGRLYAGTDKQGLVYQVEAKGKARAIFQAAQAEVRCLHWTEQALYVGTSSPGGSRAPGSSSGSVVSAAPASLQRPDGEPASAKGSERLLATSPMLEKTRDGEKSVAAPVAPAPVSGENSIYRVGHDGTARELFREKGLILCLLARGETIFVGMGTKGQLFEINAATRERTELARLDHGQIQKLVARRDGSILLAAADPGKLYRLRDRFAATGSVLSEVIDAKLPSRFGALLWKADAPAGTKLTIAARSGHVAEPDETWSAWGPEQFDARHAFAGVPPGRYLQLRLSFATNDPAASAALHHLQVRYATLNQAPEIAALEALNPDAAKDPKKLRFKWTVTDANEDELTYDLFVRKDGWSDWVRIEEGYGKTEYEWDTATMPSGIYRLKVVASDRADNPPREALSAERVSLPCVVAHDAPTVKLKFIGLERQRAVFDAEVQSPLARLASASFSIDSGKWASAFPTDGLFDSTRESLRIETDVLEPGAHVIVLRVRDAAGNIGSADAVFTVPAANK